MPALAFGFTKLVVSDLDAALRFYCEVFGMVRKGEVSTDEHKSPLDEVILSLNKDTSQHALILVRYRQLPCPPAGSAWTGFVVAEMAATLLAVEENGGVIEVAPHENEEHGVVAAIVSDPAGHLIEILQTMGSVRPDRAPSA